MSTGSLRTEVLDQFDRTWGILVMFDGNVDRSYPIDWRITARRLNDDWAITIERVDYTPVAVRCNHSVHAGIITAAFFWGNCLRYKWKPVSRPLVLNLTSDPQTGRSFLQTGDDPHPHVNPEVAAMKIRDELVPLNVDAASYAEMGISLLDYPQIRPFECLRALSRHYRQMLLPTEQELLPRFLKGRMPPAVLTLDEWLNPVVNELPSQTESVRMVAEVIASGNPDAYQPTQLPNTHWSNWPGAGSYDTEYGDDLLPPNR